MRWIFLTLLMANIAYFAHGWFDQSQEPSSMLSIYSPAIQKGARIHLLSEVNAVRAEQSGAEVREHADPVIADEVIPPVIPEEQVQVGMRAVCTSVGPFSASITAENLRQRLLVLNVDSRVSEVKLAKAPDYWVYLAPFSGRADALREVRRLHKAGLDSYVIGEGDLANGLSLGLFSRQASADKVQKEAIALGYQAQIKTVERFDLRYWVVLAPGRQGDLGDQVWEQLADRFSFAERREQLCNTQESTVVERLSDLQ